MARPLRIQYEGAVYHVYSRGNECRNIFHVSCDKETFLEFLLRTKIKYGLKIYAYVLMDNHYHLLLETRLPNLSQAMQHLTTGYTKYFNSRMARTGHLFESRYKSILVEKDSYLLELTRYIHLNPVRARIANTMEELKQFRHSSFREYAGFGSSKHLALVSVDDVLARLSDEMQRARSLYEAFVHEGIVAALSGTSPLHDAVASCVLGSEAFVKRTKESVGLKESLGGVSYKKELFSTRTKENILEAVMSHYGMADNAHAAWMEHEIPRKVAMILIKRYTPLTLREIGGMFNLCPSAVCQMEKRVEGDPVLCKEVENVETMLFM